MLGSEEYLFDVSPDADVDNVDRKKSAKRKRQKEEAPSPHVATRERGREPDDTIIAVVEDHFQCEQCGLRIVDLISVRRNTKKWLVCCGWNCLIRWEVDPVDGILERLDESQEKTELDDFVLRDGSQFDGMTFGDIWASGNGWHIELTAKVSSWQSKTSKNGKVRRPALIEAAKKFLEQKKGLTKTEGSTDTMTSITTEGDTREERSEGT
jgi:hypothetical protein